jgi:molybdopterin molybdotransferase
MKMKSQLQRVSDALRKMLSEARSSGTEVIELSSATGRISAGNIHSPMDHPQFDNAAVDGYGIRYSDLDKNGKKRFEVVAEIKAGDHLPLTLKADQAVRIFTGAPVPSYVNAVIMQENVKAIPPFIEIVQNEIVPGINIRKKGQQIRKGDRCFSKGNAFNAASIGFLSSLGVSDVKAARLSRVAVIVTGNEIIRSGKKLKKGQIFESNGVMLRSAFSQLNIIPKIYYCKDDLPAMKKIVTDAEKQHDLIIVTGGVSVGDYDFTPAAAERTGYKILIHGILQKPGKPLLFAKKKNKFLFGLPGNPRAVLTCFYEYILPFINTRMDATEVSLKMIMLPAAQEFRKKADGKTHFVTGKIRNGKVEILKGQDSHMLRSFAEADVLVTLPAEKETYKENEILTAHLLPQ